jgi:hypothetical protein
MLPANSRCEAVNIREQGRRMDAGSKQLIAQVGLAGGRDPKVFDAPLAD